MEVPQFKDPRILPNLYLNHREHVEGGELSFIMALVCNSMQQELMKEATVVVVHSNVSSVLAHCQVKNC